MLIRSSLVCCQSWNGASIAAMIPSPAAIDSSA